MYAGGRAGLPVCECEREILEELGIGQADLLQQQQQMYEKTILISIFWRQFLTMQCDESIGNEILKKNDTKQNKQTHKNVKILNII